MTRILDIGLALIGAGVIGGVVALGDFTHFTWVSLLLFAVYTVCILLNKAEDVFYWFMTVQIIVILGVWAMSGQKCELLTEALDVNGPAVYFFGNFFMHYVPFLVALEFAPFAWTPISRRQRDMTDIVLGFGTFMLYLGLYRAKDVYGCVVQDEVTFLATLGLTVVLLAFRWFAPVSESEQTYAKLMELF